MAPENRPSQKESSHFPGAMSNFGDVSDHSSAVSPPLKLVVLMALLLSCECCPYSHL